MAQSHVPKFGNWDDDNVPYTAYFENARKERAGVRMNPNDPEENPEAFSHMRGGMKSTARSHRSMPSESGSEMSNSDHSLSKSNHQRANSGQKKGRALSGSSFSSSVSHHSTQSGSHQFDRNKHEHHRTASIPKFGEWDETDPKSGEGFTAIFSKVKAQKQAESSMYPAMPPQPSNYSDFHHRKPQSSSCCLKICCCFFSHGK